MDPGLRTPLLDFFRRGEVARDIRMQAAQGSMAPRAHEQLALLMLLVDDQDPEIASAADATLTMIPRASLEAFLARSDASTEMRQFFASRGVQPADTPAPQADEPLLEVHLSDDDALLSEDPSVKLILMSATLDYERVSRAVTLGYRGVVSKDARLARLIAALEAVEQGDVAIETAPARAPDPPSRRAATATIDRLTPREQQVLELLVQAATGDEIAERLSVSPHTVRTHINNVMHKLGVHSRSEAVALAVRRGLATPGTDPTPPSSSEVA